MTPAPIDPLYQELKSLAHKPDPSKESVTLAKIQSWTPLLIKADQDDDSLTLAYILKQKPYLSQKMMQAAGCYPLHRLAKNDKWQPEDKALFEALLDMPSYFQVNALDSANNVMLTYVLTSSNPDAVGVLRMKGILEFALKDLRARVGGDLFNHFERSRLPILNLALVEESFLTQSERNAVKVKLLLQYQPSLFFEGDVKQPLFDKYLMAVLHLGGLYWVLNKREWHQTRYYDSPVLLRYLRDYSHEINPIVNGIHESNEVFLRYLVGTKLFKAFAEDRKYRHSPFQYAIDAQYWWLAVKIVEVTDGGTPEDRRTLIKTLEDDLKDDDEYQHRLTLLKKLIFIDTLFVDSEFQRKDFYQSPFINRVLHDKAHRKNILDALVELMEGCFSRKINRADISSYMLRTAEYSGHTQLWMYQTVELMQREQYSQGFEVEDGKRYELHWYVYLFLEIFGEKELYEWSNSPSSKMNFDDLMSVHNEYRQYEEYEAFKEDDEDSPLRYY